MTHVKSESGPASARRLKANRANAKMSSGPRSAEGKAQASRNALRHGLSIPAASIPHLRREIGQLARQLAGEHPDEVTRSAAEAVAEAQADLVQIRSQRRVLIASIFSKIEEAMLPEPDPASEEGGALRQKAEIDRIIRRLAPALRRIRDKRCPTPGLAAKQHVDEMARLERYERRAFSRRKRAMRTLSELLSNQAEDRG